MAGVNGPRSNSAGARERVAQDILVGRYLVAALARWQESGRRQMRTLTVGQSGHPTETAVTVRSRGLVASALPLTGELAKVQSEACLGR